MSNPNAIPFRPVRGKDASLQKMDTQDGYLYMATDTRKTYLGTESGEKILMGQDIGVFYGTKEIPPDNSGRPLDPIVEFNIANIDGDYLPLPSWKRLTFFSCPLSPTA